MTRDSFVFYRSFLDGLNAIPKKDRLACYEAIVNYALNGDELKDGVAAGVLNLVKPIIDANARKAEAGRKGGLARASKAEASSSKEQANLSKAEANSSKVKLNSKEEIVNSKEEKKNIEKEKPLRAVFQKPTVDEVKAYCRERGNNVDPNAFVDFYSAKGWRVGNQPMKDWKACVRTWERRDQKEPPKKKVGFSNYESQRQYSDDQFRAIERMMRR